MKLNGLVENDPSEIATAKLVTVAAWVVPVLIKCESPTVPHTTRTIQRPTRAHHDLMHT